jgi:hypothetical protein
MTSSQRLSIQETKNFPSPWSEGHIELDGIIISDQNRNHSWGDSSPFAPTIGKPYWVRAAVRKKSGSRVCGCRLFFAIQNTAPPLTTCGDQNLGARRNAQGHAQTP